MVCGGGYGALGKISCEGRVLPTEFHVDVNVFNVKQLSAAGGAPLPDDEIHTRAVAETLQALADQQLVVARDITFRPVYVEVALDGLGVY